MSAISSLTHAISLDPYSGEQIGAYPFDTDAALEAALQRAKVGYRQWRQVSLGQRSEYLLALASTLETKAEAFAQMISREIGKPVVQARGEVSKCVGLCRWYAEHGPAMLAAEPTQVEKARIEYRPLGPILAVMPWNFPVWQVLRGAVPAILAGNTYVLKHAPNVMGSACITGELFKDAGLPEGVFEVLNVTPDGVTRAINDPRIAAVTLTGSVRAGMAIGAQAGAALKKCVLELGGSDPFIVLADADLDAAVKAAVIGRYQNTGQVCAAAKRLIVEESIVDEFTRKFVEATRELKVGNPWKKVPTSAQWPVTTCATSWMARSRRPSPKAPPCCWGPQGRWRCQLLRADRVCQRHPTDDCVQAGAVRAGSGDHQRT